MGVVFRPTGDVVSVTMEDAALVIMGDAAVVIMVGRVVLRLRRRGEGVEIRLVGDWKNSVGWRWFLVMRIELATTSLHISYTLSMKPTCTNPLTATTQ